MTPRARRGARASSTATPTTSTCRASTRSRSRPAPPAATRRRSTASRSSASCATASRASRCSSAAACRPSRGSRATSACSSAGRGDRGAPRDPGHLARRPPLARLARQVPDEVHGRRLGPEGVRAEVERRLGYALPSFALRPIDVEPDDHLGIRAQKPTAGLASACPSTSGCSAAHGLVALADLLEPLGAEARITRQQNLLLANVPAADVDAVVAALAGLELAPRARRASRQRDRLYRGAALQLLGDRDQVAARCADRRAGRRGSARTSRSCGCTSTAARTRARSTGSATSASRGRPPATRTGSAARRTTSTSAAALGPRRRDRAAGVPARADAGARRARSHGLVGGWLDEPGGGREHARVLRQDDGRRARPPGRARAGTSEPERGGGRVTQRSS